MRSRDGYPNGGPHSSTASIPTPASETRGTRSNKALRAFNPAFAIPGKENRVDDDGSKPPAIPKTTSIVKPDMRNVVVAGIGQTDFGSFLDRNVRSLAEEALDRCVRDAGLSIDRIGVTYFANALSGLITGQETIRGQVALRHMGLMGQPIINIDNACASGSSALHSRVAIRCLRPGRCGAGNRGREADA